MRIAILGWGSLIWDPRELPREGSWADGGPLLRIEFSRVSSDARLTLVIDPCHGVSVPTKFIRSPRTDLEDVICDLRSREKTVTQRIGFVNLITRTERSNADPQAAAIIREWGSAHEFDAVVWTDLRSNFLDETGRPFSLENAVAYLMALPKGVARRARKYIQNAPDDVATPLRQLLRKAKWLDY